MSILAYANTLQSEHFTGIDGQLVLHRLSWNDDENAISYVLEAVGLRGRLALYFADRLDLAGTLLMAVEADTRGRRYAVLASDAGDLQITTPAEDVTVPTIDERTGEVRLDRVVADDRPEVERRSDVDDTPDWARFGLLAPLDWDAGYAFSDAETEVFVTLQRSQLRKMVRSVMSDPVIPCL